MMKNNRRDFLKHAGLAGLSAAGATILPACSSGAGESAAGGESISKLDNIREQAMKKHTQQFNMSGYAAPKLDTVRIGFIGLGNRGPVHVESANRLEGVEIKALCDIRPEKAHAAKELLKGSSHHPEIYTGKEDWKKLCEREDIDLVYIATPWNLHTPMAVYAMEQGKHACTEVPAATTLEECWQLVETSERTRKHCMMLENSCYGTTALITLNMVRQGFFGELIHAEGAYIHDLVEGDFAKDKYWDFWRLKQNIGRNGNLYPTHGIGPICQQMDIGRGDNMDYMVSVSSNDFSMNKFAERLAAVDDFYKQYVGRDYRGNMNTSTIRTHKGRTIVLQHDTSSPRPRPETHVLSGTKAIAQRGKISIPSETDVPLEAGIWHTSYMHEWVSEQEYKALEEEFTPDILKKVGEVSKHIGSHGGTDFVMDWRTIDSLRNGLPLDQNVYDAALWSAIAPLSEWCVANRATIEVPDFTGGSWKNNQPVDISLEKGGNTNVKG